MANALYRGLHVSGTKSHGTRSQWYEVSKNGGASLSLSRCEGREEKMDEEDIEIFIKNLNLNLGVYSFDTLVANPGSFSVLGKINTISDTARYIGFGKPLVEFLKPFKVGIYSMLETLYFRTILETSYYLLPM